MSAIGSSKFQLRDGFGVTLTTAPYIGQVLTCTICAEINAASCVEYPERVPTMRSTGTRRGTGRALDGRSTGARQAPDLHPEVRRGPWPPTICPMSAGDPERAASTGPALTVAALARRLGVAPATLRTWDRRYGLGPSGHSAGSHRRYTPSDVHRLEVMRRLTREGVLPGEAARIALSYDAMSGEIGGTESVERSVPLHDTDAAVRGLVRAAQALDAQAIDRTISASLESHGVLWTWDCLLAPALIAIGDKWGTGGVGVDVEHLLADGVLRALCTVTSTVAEPRNARPVLLACAPEELHSLPLHARAAALSERGIDVRVLGARVPPEALSAAVKRAGASAVFVWAHAAETASGELLSAVPSIRPPVALVVGGPGWAGGAPAGATCVQQLSEAVTVLQRAAVG